MVATSQTQSMEMDQNSLHLGKTWDEAMFIEAYYQQITGKASAYEDLSEDQQNKGKNIWRKLLGIPAAADAYPDTILGMTPSAGKKIIETITKTDAHPFQAGIDLIHLPQGMQIQRNPQTFARNILDYTPELSHRDPFSLNLEKLSSQSETKATPYTSNSWIDSWEEILNQDCFSTQEQRREALEALRKVVPDDCQMDLTQNEGMKYYLESQCMTQDNRPVPALTVLSRIHSIMSNPALKAADKSFQWKTFHTSYQRLQAQPSDSNIQISAKALRYHPDTLHLNTGSGAIRRLISEETYVSSERCHLFHPRINFQNRPIHQIDELGESGRNKISDFWTLLAYHPGQTPYEEAQACLETDGVIRTCIQARANIENDERPPEIKYNTTKDQLEKKHLKTLAYALQHATDETPPKKTWEACKKTIQGIQADVDESHRGMSGNNRSLTELMGQFIFSSPQMSCDDISMLQQRACLILPESNMSKAALLANAAKVAVLDRKKLDKLEFLGNRLEKINGKTNTFFSTRTPGMALDLDIAHANYIIDLTAHPRMILPVRRTLAFNHIDFGKVTKKGEDMPLSRQEIEDEFFKHRKKSNPDEPISQHPSMNYTRNTALRDMMNNGIADRSAFFYLIDEAKHATTPLITHTTSPEVIASLKTIIQGIEKEEADILKSEVGKNITNIRDNDAQNMGGKVKASYLDETPKIIRRYATLSYLEKNHPECFPNDYLTHAKNDLYAPYQGNLTEGDQAILDGLKLPPTQSTEIKAYLLSQGKNVEGGNEKQQKWRTHILTTMARAKAYLCDDSIADLPSDGSILFHTIVQCLIDKRTKPKEIEDFCTYIINEAQDFNALPHVSFIAQKLPTCTTTQINSYLKHIKGHVTEHKTMPNLFTQLITAHACTLFDPEKITQQVKTIESVSQKFPSLTREIQQRLDRPGISTKERTTQWDLIAKLGNHYQAKHSDEFATLLLHLDNPELQTTINTIFKRNGTEKNTALNRLLPHFVLQEDWESVQGLTTLTATDDQLSTAIDIAYQKPPFPPLSWLKDNVEKEQDDITRAYDTFVKNPFNEDDLTQILAKKDGFDASYALQQYKKIQSAGTRKMPIDDISRLLKKLEQKLNEFDKLSQQDLLEKNNEASPSSHDATDISAEDNTLITRLAISAITLKRTAFDEQRDETGKRRIQNGKPVKQGQRLNSTQMLTLLLKLKAQSEKREVFTQIRTGEGKSRIAAVEAGVHLLSGKTIHLATSNQALARRDQKEYQQFFQGLDHQSDTIHAGLDPKTYLDLHAPKVLYSETSQWTLCHSRAIQQGNTWPKNAVLLMDECDLSLHDRNPKNIAAVKPALRNLDLVYPLITNIIQKQPKITKQALKKALEDKYPAFKQATSNYQQYDWLKQCDTWINSARKASALEQGKHFTVSVPCTQIIDGVGHQLPRITVLRNDGLPEHGSTFSDGVYQFILAKLWLNDDHRKGAFRCPPEYMTERRSYITTLCQQYDKVSGISGTTRQYEALRSPDCLPETRSVMMIPTHKNLKRKEKHRTFTSSKKKRKTIEKLLRSHAKKKTPAIIFCQDAKEVRALHQWISENTSIPTGDKAWQLRTYTSHDHVQSQHAMKAMVQQINQGGQQIIITTSVLGRGCNTSANDMLGILTHTPETKADAEQIIGRFGRYGKKATVVSLIDCQAKGYASIGADKRQEADWSTRDASDKVHRIFHDARAKLIQTVQETQTKKDFDCQRFLTETDNIWSQSPAADGQIDVLGDQYQTTMNQYTSSLINLVEYAKTQVPENTIQLDIPALVEHANQFRKDAITEQRKPMVRANKIIFGHGVVCLALSVAVVIPPVIAYFTLPTLGITEIMLIVTGMIGLSLTIIGATTALTSQHKLNKLEQISYPPLTNKTNAHELNHMKQDENNKPVNNQGRREAKTSKKTQTHGMS